VVRIHSCAASKKQLHEVEMLSARCIVQGRPVEAVEGVHIGARRQQLARASGVAAFGGRM
jgi:hypothetical protein